MTIRKTPKSVTQKPKKKKLKTKVKKRIHPAKIALLNVKKKKAKETAKILAKLPESKPKLNAKTLKYNRKLEKMLEKLENILKEMKDTVKGFDEETGEYDEEEETAGQDIPGNDEEFLQL